MKKGFTLLELLIVVVIIGILAAIAVPQFFKIAERARCSEGVHLLGAIRSSQLRYYSEHGTTAGAIGDLDVGTSPAKYFVLTAVNSVDYVNGAEVLATADRNAVTNPGFGAYTLSSHGNGDVTCAGGTGRCGEIGF